MSDRILIVEDDTSTRDSIQAFLEHYGYTTQCAKDGREALEVFHAHEFDLVILDIMLPYLSGFEVLSKIRKTYDTPVIMLSALDDELSQLNSFDEAADDYITKPFSLKLLDRRIQSVLKRQHKSSSHHVWSKGHATVDFSSYTATLDDTGVDIKPREITLFKFLVENPNQVFTRQQLLDNLWVGDDVPFDRVIDVYIKNLRKKLDLDCLVTVKGIGYKYEDSQ